MLFKLRISGLVDFGLVVLADGDISTLVSGFGFMLSDGTPCIIYADFPLFQ